MKSTARKKTVGLTRRRSRLARAKRGTPAKTNVEKLVGGVTGGPIRKKNRGK